MKILDHCMASRTSINYSVYVVDHTEKHHGKFYIRWEANLIADFHSCKGWRPEHLQGSIIIPSHDQRLEVVKVCS